MIPAIERFCERAGRPPHIAGRPVCDLSDAELLMTSWRLGRAFDIAPDAIREDPHVGSLLDSVIAERNERGV